MRLQRVLNSHADRLPSCSYPIANPRVARASKRIARCAVASKVAPATDSGIDPDHEPDVLIEFKDVYKSFGDKVILQGASFKIRRGEAVGIIGASGTGKSTTLRIAAGLLAPDRGEVLIQGKRRVGLLSDSKEEEPLKVGMVFQNAALFDSLTVGKNVGFLLYEHSDLPTHKIEAKVAESLGKVTESLGKVGLRGVENMYPSELSGGMKKRVALARAVVSDILMYDEPTAGLDPVASTVVKDLMQNMWADVLMYDEPTAGLDPVASTVVEDLMRTMWNDSLERSSILTNGEYSDKSNGEGEALMTSSFNEPMKGIASYIVVTHQHSTIRRAVDRIIFLHEGKVVWEGPTSQFDTTDEPIVRQFADGTLDGPINYI
eukprot:gene4058-14144_t